MDRPSPPVASFLADHGLIGSSARPIPGGYTTVAALLTQRAREIPDAIALADRHRSLTYRDLAAAVESGAGQLEALGLRPLDRVAVSLPNTAEVVVTFLAAMRVGLIWVGINTHLAPPEQAYLLTDSGASVLLAAAPIVAAAREHSPTVEGVVVNPGAPQPWWSGGATPSIAIDDLDPYAPAAISYTSGTTGRPKGAVHSQRNMIMSPVSITRREPQPLVQGVCLPLTILNMQVLGTVQPLLSGGTIVPMDRIDTLGVAEWIRDFGIERMYSTPPTVYDLLTRPEIDPTDLRTLSHLGVGGAKCPEGLREAYRERFGRDFAFGYGLTEAPTSVTGPFGPGDEVGPPGSSGREREHVSVTIRDAGGDVVAVGVEGEICVGPALAGELAGCYTTMLGYWDRPDATAEALRGGVLHTGDVGVIDADGILWVKDRRSDLIIHGGANVYPAEVERVVEASGLVSEISVVGREHDRLGEEVVAFVGAAPGLTLTHHDLASACRDQIAAYKIPVAWYEVDRFPRNAMGKVLKPRLRSWLTDPSSENEIDVRLLEP